MDGHPTVICMSFGEAFVPFPLLLITGGSGVKFSSKNLCWAPASRDWSQKRSSRWFFPFISLPPDELGILGLLAAAAAQKMKEAQPCFTLRNPMDCSPPGSSVHGILQARILEWVVIPSPGDLPDPEIELRSPALQADSLPSEPPGELCCSESL